MSANTKAITIWFPSLVHHKILQVFHQDIAEFRTAF